MEALGHSHESSELVEFLLPETKKQSTNFDNAANPKLIRCGCYYLADRGATHDGTDRDWGDVARDVPHPPSHRGIEREEQPLEQDLVVSEVGRLRASLFHRHQVCACACAENIRIVIGIYVC